MKRIVGILLGVVIGIAFLAAALLLFLGASERGTRVLASQAESFLPVQIEGISGTLWGELRAGRVRLELGDASLEIREFEVALRFWPLIFDNLLHVARARAQAVVYTSDAAPAEPDRPIRLELPPLPLAIRLDQLSLDRLELADQAFTDVSGSALWSPERLVLGYLDFTIAGVSVALSGRLEAGANPVLSADFLWFLPIAELEGSGSLVGVTDRLRLEHRLEGRYRGDVRGQLNLALPAQPRFDLELDVDPFRVGDVAVDAVAGTASGSLDALHVAVQGSVDVPQLGAFPVAAELRGSVAGPYALALSGEPLSGAVTASGRLAFDEGVDLALLGEARDLDLSPLLAELVESASARASASVGLAYRDERLELDVRNLQGEFDGRPVAGSAQAVLTSAGWRLDPVAVSVGANRIWGAVELQDEVMAIAAEIAAPDLAALRLGVEGDLAASVDARGSWPSLEGSVDVESARLAGFDAVAVGLSGSIVMAPDGLSASVAAQSVEAADLLLKGLRAAAQGQPEALTWDLEWSEGRAAGRYARSGTAHAVTLARLELQAFEQRWTSAAPTRVTYDQGAVEASGFCLDAEGSSACVSKFVYRGGQIDTAGRLEALPLGFASPWVSLPLRDDGYVEGTWAIEGAPGAWTGSLDLAARALFLLMPDAEEAAIELPDLTLEGYLDGETLRLDVAAVDPGFSFSGSASVVPAGPAGVLDGRLALAVTDLSVLKAFDYRIESLTGELRGSVILTGTLQAPRFEGLFQVVDADLRLNDPDLALQGLQASVAIDDSGSFDLKASASSDGAPLTVRATGGGVFDGALVLDGSLVGEGLQARHPDWTVTLSPDLTVRLRDGRANVTGRIEIPVADVRINTLPTSLPRPSEDVVVVGRQEAARSANGRVTVDVELVLGDDVVLSAAGVEARLAGTLKARLDRRGRTSVRGKLDVSGGIVSTQGQTLTLESGSIVYNGPITNPYLDVRAVRLIDDRSPPVKVGLHIRGNANNLTTSVFSDPAMAEARALSFLVLGRDLEEGSTGDSNQVLAAAINLGLSRAGGITSEIKRITGLDELSAMAESQDSFAIVAGKRITEDVYVRYTYDTLTTMSALLVRYSLTDRWHLEARSSEYSSMDLMYTFEQ